MSEKVRRVSRDFATFPETRFAAQGPGEGRRIQAATQRPPLHLTWASLNVRSIYGREKTLKELRCLTRISILALQETFERANDPPVGLFESVYSKPSDDGRRGVMLIVHPLLEKAAQSESGLGDSNRTFCGSNWMWGVWITLWPPSTCRTTAGTRRQTTWRPKSLVTSIPYRIGPS